MEIPSVNLLRKKCLYHPSGEVRSTGLYTDSGTRERIASAVLMSYCIKASLYMYLHFFYRFICITNNPCKEINGASGMMLLRGHAFVGVIWYIPSLTSDSTFFSSSISCCQDSNAEQMNECDK